MISTFFLTVFASFASLLVGLLPTGILPVAVGTAIAYFVGVANAYSYVVPIDTLLQALAIVLVFDGSILAWHFINWIIRKVPGMQ